MGKKLGKLFGLAVITGVAAAAVSYYRQYRDFHKDLDAEFHDYENDTEDSFPKQSASASNRNYVSLNANKDEFTVAAKDTFEAAKGMASSAKEMLKDVGHIIADNVRDSRFVAGDTAKQTAAKVKTAVQSAADKLKGGEENDLSGEQKNAADQFEDTVSSAADEAFAQAASAKKAAEGATENAENLAEDIAENAEALAENSETLANGAAEELKKATSITEDE